MWPHDAKRFDAYRNSDGLLVSVIHIEKAVKSKQCDLISRPVTGITKVKTVVVDLLF